MYLTILDKEEESMSESIILMEKAISYCEVNRNFQEKKINNSI